MRKQKYIGIVDMDFYLTKETTLEFVAFRIVGPVLIALCYSYILINLMNHITKC